MNYSGLLTDEEYAQQLAPYLLNAICKLSDQNTATKVSKIEAFEISSARGHKGNGNVYSSDVETAIGVLANRNFIQHHLNPACVTITEQGIRMCKTQIDHGGWYRDIYSSNN